MTGDEIQEIIGTLRRTRTDIQGVEAKKAEADLPRDLWQTLSAFANTHGGGILILGIEEKTGFGVTGVKDVRRTMDNLASLCCEMDPAIRAVVESHNVEGKAVVVAEIPECDPRFKPCYHKRQGVTNGSCVRVADGNHRLSSYEVQMLISARIQPAEDREVVLEASPSDLDPELVGALVNRLRNRGSVICKDGDTTGTLKRLGVLVAYEGSLRPTLAGLLALGIYPQQFFPALAATFVVYPTLVVGAPGPGQTRFLDNRRLDGPIPVIVQSVMTAVRRNMKQRAVVNGAFREDVWEYPEEAIREAVVNALAHRDLSLAARGMAVQIQMFPDRICIINAGGLYGPVTLDTMGRGGLSACRNQLLMRLLEDTPVTPEGRVVCENRGSGVATMLEALGQAGMRPPHFEDKIATFQVTFSNESIYTKGLGEHGLARRETGNRVRDRGVYTFTDLGESIGEGSYEPPFYQTHSERSRMPRGDRRDEILALLGRYGELSRSELAQHANMNDAAVARWLRILRAEKKIDPTEEIVKSRSVRYRLRGAKE